MKFLVPALALLCFTVFSDTAEAQADLVDGQFQLQQNAQLTAPAPVPVTVLPPQPLQLETPPRGHYGLWSIMWSLGAVATLGFTFTYWLDNAFCTGPEGCSRNTGWLWGAGIGFAMFVGGLVGHIIGGIRHRRRVREFYEQQAALSLEHRFAW